MIHVFFFANFFGLLLSYLGEIQFFLLFFLFFACINRRKLQAFSVVEMFRCILYGCCVMKSLLYK